MKNEKSKSLEDAYTRDLFSQKKEQAITLIALVITIIVLLILAGVTISTLTGENGILTQASEAKLKTEIEAEKEAIKIAMTALKADQHIHPDNYPNGYIEANQLKSEMDKSTPKPENITLNSSTKQLIVQFDSSRKNRTYTVSQDVLISEGNTEGENKHFSEEELKERLDIVTKPNNQTKAEDIGVDENGEVVNLDRWRYYRIDEDTCEIAGDDYVCAYEGRIINGAIEDKIPAFIKIEGKKYKVSKLGRCVFESMWGGNTNISVFPHIPFTINEISESFRNCDKLTVAEIPNTVKTIGGSTFEGCTELTSIEIPDSVTTIGAAAFYDTKWYNNQSDGEIYINRVFYQYKGVMPENTKILIKNDTVTISDGAFNGCTGLTSITIPNSVTDIYGAFNGCIGLTSITIPNSITRIDWLTFIECTGLTSIDIPNSVTEIDDDAFFTCTNLKTINIDKEPNSLVGSPWGATNATINWRK